MRTVNVFYLHAMFHIGFFRDDMLVHVAKRIRILPEEFIDWLVAEKLP